MAEDFVVRYVVKLDEQRFLMYEDREDVEDWDEILEIQLPQAMAFLLDYVQVSYWNMQNYLEAQWESMQRLLALDEDTPLYNETAGSLDMVMDGDSIAFMEQFNKIVKTNRLEDINDIETD